jgi:uncharacterized protein (DUF58 family)
MDTLKTIQLKARHQVYTLLSGHNLSKLYGEGYDFAELREYQMGDDIRKINWTISAKLGKPYVKVLHSNRELSVVVASFMDGGVYFGTGNTKQHQMTHIATLLGYSAQQSNDLFTGISYTPQHIYTTPPTKQIFHIEQFSHNLYHASLLHTTLNTKNAVQNLFTRLYKRSLVFVISDFLEEMDLSLLAQKHEVIAVIVRDKNEEAPKKLGEATLLDPRADHTMHTYFGKKSQAMYLAKRQVHDDTLIEHFTRHDIRWVKIFSDEDPLKKLVQLLN